MNEPPPSIDPVDQQRAGADDSLVTVLAVFADDGFTTDHRVVEHGRVACGACSAETSPDRVRATAQHRIEGSSDPDDLQLVVGLSCPTCGTAGAVVVRYGPSAPEHDAAFLGGADLDRAADPLAANDQRS